MLTAPHAATRTLRSLRANRELVGNAGSLLGSTVITSLLGFVFWWLAARLVPVEVVGYGSAAVSAMMLLATFGMLGMNTLLTGELARRAEGRGGLLTAALLASLAAGAVLGAGFAAVATLSGGAFAPYAVGPVRALVFVGCTALTAALLVLDEALIGMLLGSVQLWRNGALAAAKLFLLWLAVLYLHDRYGVAILTAWAAGTAVSAAVALAVLHLRGLRCVHRPDWRVLRALTRSVAAHNWLNAALQAPRLSLPIVATALSAREGGAFYVAWTIATVATIVPTHLTTVLYAVGAADPSVLRGKLAFTLRTCLLGGLVGVPLLVLVAHPLLRLYGPAYAAEATTPLRLLALGYFPAVIKAHYVALCRIQRRVSTAAALCTVTCVVRIGAAAAGGLVAGLTGLSAALLAAMVAEGLVMLPMVLREVRPPTAGHGWWPSLERSWKR